MAEETKAAVRLSKVAKEFNIAVATIVEFLAKKGHEIESNPNSRITAEQYALLSKEYKSDKAIKQEAASIDLGLGKRNESLTVEDVKKDKETVEVDDFAKEDKELTIRGVSLDTPKKATKTKAAKDKKAEESVSGVDLFSAEKDASKMVEAKVEAKIEAKAEPKAEPKAENVAVETAPQADVAAKAQEKEPKAAALAENLSQEKKAENLASAAKVEEALPKAEPKAEAASEPKAETVETASKADVAAKAQEKEPKAAALAENLAQEKKAENLASVAKTEESLPKAEAKIGVKAEPKTELKAEKPQNAAAAQNAAQAVAAVAQTSVQTETKTKAASESSNTEAAAEASKHGSKQEEKPFRLNTGINGPKVLGVVDVNNKNKKGISVPEELVNQPKVIHSVVRVEEKIEKEEAKPKPVEEKKDNFIPTQKITLEGPRLTGEKIDLGQFERKPKPVASSRDANFSSNNKKKRPRTGEKKQEGAAANNNNNKQQHGGLGNRPNQNNGQNNAKNKNNQKNNKKKKEQFQVDSQEIEKTLKETLSMLSPLGKSKASKHRKEKRQTISQNKEREQERQIQEQKILKVTEFITVNELSTMMNVPVTEIISTCMSLGLFVSINQRLTADPISLLAEEYGYSVEFVDAEVLENLEKAEEEGDFGEGVPRVPIVTVMGHVDHGKTSLLDYIRKTNVIAGEAGGITQHIGAYEVQLENGKKITFLDTPGHEAFTAMRARGAKITDIAIIVVSADDKVMPQTVEAINHAQAAGVPIVFAINKIDKPGADPDRIKTELADMNLLVEEWGGKYQSQDISAKQGINVEALLEKVLLEAELLDLKANPEKRGKGTVVESSLDKGRGYVAKILVQDGTISVGDPIVAGAISGKVKAMYNERNQAVKKAGPSVPVLLLGLNGAPQAGDTFNVTKDEKEAKEIAGRRQQLQREQGLRTQKHITLDEIGRRIAIGDFKELNIIVKGDVDGSIEALSDSLLKLSNEEVQVNVIHKSVGQITESDVLLASASNAIIIGFQVRPSLPARKLAESEQIDIRLYSIIYDAINELKDAIEGMLSPEIQEKIVSNLEIREVFKISKVGSVAGCFVLDGRLARQTKIRIIRDGIVVYTGKLGSLRRFKDDVKEVLAGQDCGLNIENFNDIKVGDIIEGYEQTEVKRTL